MKNQLQLPPDFFGVKGAELPFDELPAAAAAALLPVLCW